MAAGVNVAFCRPLILGDKGDDVRVHKRGLSRARPDLYPWMDFTELFGERFETAVKQWQADNKIRPTGKIGSPTHELLERAHRHGSRTKFAFTNYDAVTAKAFCVEFSKTPDQKVRERIVSSARFWYQHRLSIDYSQARPFQLGKPAWYPSRWDCSGFLTGCHYAGDAPDPNNRGYDHEGYTGTLQNTGIVVGSIHDLDPGDAIFYGSTRVATPAFPVGSPTHVALYIGVVDGLPMVISNGHYPMGLYPYNYRTINHLRHYTVA